MEKAKEKKSISFVLRRVVIATRTQKRRRRGPSKEPCPGSRARKEAKGGSGKNRKNLEHFMGSGGTVGGLEGVESQRGKSDPYRCALLRNGV